MADVTNPSPDRLLEAFGYVADALGGLDGRRGDSVRAITLVAELETTGSVKRARELACEILECLVPAATKASDEK